MNDELFEKLVKLIERENKTQTETITEGFKKEITKIQSVLTEIQTKIEEEANKVKDLAEKHSKLEKKCSFLERSIRRNNIIIFGLESKSDNLAEYTINQLNQYLQLNLSLNNINNIHTVGVNDHQQNRPIIVEFISLYTKIEVLKNCKKLKGSHISISDDLTEDDRAIRKQLLIHQKQARSKGLRSYIKGNKLVINEEIYTLKELELGNTEEGRRTETRTIQLKEVGNSTFSPTLLISDKKEGAENFNLEEMASGQESDKKRKLEQSPGKIQQDKAKKPASNVTTRSNSRNRVTSVVR